MKYILSLVLLLAFGAAQAQSTAEKAVIATEKARFDAQVAKDYDALDKLLADDLVYTHSNGNTDSKQTYIQSIKDGKSNYGSVDIKEQKVRLYGNFAIINGVAHIMMNAADGKVNELKLRYTDAYIKQGKQWKMVTWQSLRLNQ